MQSFTARMPLLTATSGFGLGRRRWSSQQCYLHCLRTAKCSTWNASSACLLTAVFTATSRFRVAQTTNVSPKSTHRRLAKSTAVGATDAGSATTRMRSRLSAINILRRQSRDDPSKHRDVLNLLISTRERRAITQLAHTEDLAWTVCNYPNANNCVITTARNLKYLACFIT